MTDYVINLVNQSESTQAMWCFLAPPPGLSDQGPVYATSTAVIMVPANGTGSFMIPDICVVGAGAMNVPVELDAQILSDVNEQVSPGDRWEVNYATVPPMIEPNLNRTGEGAPQGSIAIATNAFNRAFNEAHEWYANQSFGMQADAGFLGVTWSPEPAQTVVLTPQPLFHIATGAFESGTLVDWGEVAAQSAEVNVPSSFSADQCTVTLQANGTWQVSAGAPQLSPDEERAAAEVSLAVREMTNILVSVSWDQPIGYDGGNGGETHLTGTVILGMALTAAFSIFICAGIQFNITKGSVGAVRVAFDYRGARPPVAIKSLLVPGTRLVFTD